MVVGLTLVDRQLLAAVRQRVHAHVLIEAQFIRPVLTLHLAVVARRGDPDPVVFSVCPTGTFILCCELIVFSPVYHTFGRNILYVQLIFCPGYAAR